MKKTIKKLDLKKETLAQMTVKSTVKAGLLKVTLHPGFTAGGPVCIG